MKSENLMYWKGTRNADGKKSVIMSTDGKVWANVPLYLKEVNHSLTGFEWGYCGSGPAQLAYAILRTFFEIKVNLSPKEAKVAALKEYYNFKNDVVCNYFGDSDEWKLDSDQIRIWRVGGGIDHNISTTVTSGCPVQNNK